MAHLNDTMVHGFLDVTQQIILTSRKYNVAKYNSGLIFGDTGKATQLVGNGITIDSESILKLLAAGAITIENTSGGITIKSADALSAIAAKALSLTAQNGKATLSASDTVEISGASLSESVTGAKSVTVGGNSTETVTGSTNRTMKGGETEAVTGNSSKTVSGNLSESADGSASITGKTGTTITGNGTTGVKLVGTRLCVPNASYGTSDPPSGAQTGEVYFKIIS